jgi:hypothetical protein
MTVTVKAGSSRGIQVAPLESSPTSASVVRWRELTVEERRQSEREQLARDIAAGR